MGFLCCLFRESCNIRDLYVACLVCLATYGVSMLLVWCVLQHTGLLCCLFDESCNIESGYLSCFTSLDKYKDLQHCLSHPTSNIHPPNIACRASLAMFRPPTLLIAPHLQYSSSQHCLSRLTCNIQTSNIACHTSLAIFSLPISKNIKRV